MRATSSIRSCTRYAANQHNTQQFYSSANHPRSILSNTHQPLSIRSRHFTSSSVSLAPQNPPRKPSDNPMSSLIRDTRASEPTQPPSAKSTTGTTSSMADWADLLNTARNNITSPPRSATAASSNPTQKISSWIQDADHEVRNGPAISLRLRPTLGRTVDGLHGDPSRGFRQMERKCKENNIRQDMRSQEKHVRRGQRRKNLRIMRWRSLFMEGFKSELNTIRRMRQQGW